MSESDVPMPVCPDCRVEMELGWEVNRDLHGTVQSEWQKGEARPEPDIVAIFRNFMPTIPIITYRCPSCGLLRQFANKVKKRTAMK